MKLKRSKLSQISKELNSDNARKLLKGYSSDALLRGKEEGKTHSTRHGVLVWAKNVGSIYWPAFIVHLEDKQPDSPLLEADTDKNSCAFVLFLESKFRLSALTWERIIPVVEDHFEEQMGLICKLNILESKKSNCCSLLFKRSVEYLEEFRAYGQEDRYSIAQQKYLEFEAQRAKSRKIHGTQLGLEAGGCITRPTKSAGNHQVCLVLDGPGTKLNRKTLCLDSLYDEIKKHSVTNEGSETVKKHPDPVTYSYRKRSASRLSTPNLKKGEEPRRKHGRYSLRPVPLQPIPQKPILEEEALPAIVIESPQAEIKEEDQALLKEQEDKKKGLRPKTGGKELKTWAAEKFEAVDKTFKFESHKFILCTSESCGKAIEGETAVYCHEFPFHRKCLREIKGAEETKYKCGMCLAKQCFLCKKSDDSCVKCSKCELRYHINCLRPFPQAEIQSEAGPLTCPLHYCHTCIAEHEILKKVRNYKVGKSGTLRCIKCPTSYHRTCVPASCISSIRNGYLICPRHQNFQTGSKCRRLGCFMCNKRLVCKDKPGLVNCTKCPLTYHVQCVVDVATFDGNVEALNEYMSTFECESCFWGLYPLPGQTVWCQQAAFCFWPARILYPKESSVRTVNSHTSDSFSVVYFGSQQSYYDGARYTRVVPLNIGAYDVLKKIKMYTDDPKLMTAYEEGTYVMDMSESYRSSILPTPEPVYKKIEKNVYKSGKARNNGKKSSHNDTSCACHEEDGVEDICGYGSGCLNRDQAIECDDTTCKDSTRCTNRMFVRSSCSTKVLDSSKTAVNMIAFPTINKGWGVRTTAVLKKGDFVVEYVGEVISKELYQWRLQRKAGSDSLYFLELDTNLYIDAEYMGNLSRLINHSCDPNCSPEKYQSQEKQVVGIFANCDIQPGTELTFDYGYESSGKPFSCACGASNCRGQINRSHIRNNQVGESGDSDISPSYGRLDEEWKDKCEVCSYAGAFLLCCEAPDCDKAYHAGCLGLTNVPAGTWICPEHTDLHDTPTAAKKKRKKSQSTGIPVGKKPVIRNNKENLNKKNRSNVGGAVKVNSNKKRKSAIVNLELSK